VSAAYRDTAPDLGPLVKLHPNDAKGCGLVLVALLAIPALLAAVVQIVTGYWLGLACEVVGVGAIVWLLRRPGRPRRPPPGVIELHEEGLLLRVGETTTAMRFDEVKTVTSEHELHRRSLVRTEKHRVEARDGRVIEFGTGWRLPRDLHDAIMLRTLPRLRTEALRAFDAGETVRFGPLALDEEGILPDKQPLLPWSEAARVTVENGAICLWKTDTWEKKGKLYDSTDVARVPNAYVLVEMIGLAIEREREEA
jgi:hypothetical protein